MRAVDGVSMSVAAGEMVALYGPSGSGKTTLLLMVAALLAPTSGNVLVNGRDISSLSEREASHFRLQEMGFVRQNFDLLPGVSTIDNTVLKLLKNTPWKEAHVRVQPLLERLGLGGRLTHRSETLSMGERQRVMIAGRCPPSPSCCLPMSRLAVSTPSAGARCSNCCGSYAASAAWRSSSSATIRRPPPTRTACLRCATASWSTTTLTRALRPPAGCGAHRATARRRRSDLGRQLEVRERASPLSRAPACAGAAGVLRDRRDRGGGRVAVRLTDRQLEPVQLGGAAQQRHRRPREAAADRARRSRASKNWSQRYGICRACAWRRRCSKLARTRKGRRAASRLSSWGRREPR